MSSESGRAAPLEQQFTAVAARIEPVLEELFPRGKDSYLTDAVWYHLGTGGKRIRPAICLLACERFGGDSDRALYFAAAVEILHNMLLIHDDIEDGDTMRRDRETVWVRFGRDNAINVGDYMLGVAYEAILRSPVTDDQRVDLVQAFSAAYTDTCRGQAFDLNTRGLQDLSVERYLEMARLKTGRYMALGMLGGAIIADAGPDVMALVGQLGEYMGAAFQIRDDMIDLTAGKGRGGVVGNDIREGKSSILYAHAINAAGPEERDELSDAMAKPREQTTDADVERVRGIYDRLGSLEFARAEADRLAARALEVIGQMPVEDKEFFRQVTEYMVSRKR